MADLHPLRTAYLDAIRTAYGKVARGDPDPVLTETAARSVLSMGLSYNAYVDIALRLCAGWVAYYKWDYPPYNAVIGNKMLGKVKHLMGCSVSLSNNDNQSDDEALFEHELLYATSYVDWWMGNGPKPVREEEVPTHIRSQVAQYLCKIHGVPYSTSNYNHVCLEIERSGH